MQFQMGEELAHSEDCQELEPIPIDTIMGQIVWRQVNLNRWGQIK